MIRRVTQPEPIRPIRLDPIRSLSTVFARYRQPDDRTVSTSIPVRQRMDNPRGCDMPRHLIDGGESQLSPIWCKARRSLVLHERRLSNLVSLARCCVLYPRRVDVAIVSRQPAAFCIVVFWELHKQCRPSTKYRPIYLSCPF